MICVDTTFLIDLWRNKDVPSHPAVEYLRRVSGEVFAAPAHAVGEFLEGGACVSEERLERSKQFIRLFQIGQDGFGTAEHYARIVANLRSRSLLEGASKSDMWIAAWAVEHGCTLLTRNVRHYQDIPGLRVVSY